MRLDCAQMENDFLRKRLQQCEERLDSEMKARTELEQKVRGGGGSGPEGPGKLVSSLPSIVRGHYLVLGKKDLCCWNKRMGEGSEGRVVAQLPSVQTQVTGPALTEITRLWALGSGL